VRVTWLPAALAVAGVLACQRPAPGTVELVVTVPPGASWSAALDSLTRRGIVRSRVLFDIAARVKGVPDQLKTGTYAFRPGEHYGVIFAALTTGRGRELRLVVPEGLMLSEIAALVERELAISQDSLIAAAGDPELVREFGVPAATLEGYLYPETYFVPDGISARRVVRVMAEEFQARWAARWTARLDSLGLTRHQLVTLASIIEGEVFDSSERRLVSAVYHNRLRIGMPLQADPTVIYALGTRRRLLERDYRIEHPYNTYRIPGLPPGPVGSPGAASLEAATAPLPRREAPYLYFVARPDRTHIFSRTLAEHTRARAAVSRMRPAPNPPPGGGGGPQPPGPSRP